MRSGLDRYTHNVRTRRHTHVYLDIERHPSERAYGVHVRARAYLPLRLHAPSLCLLNTDSIGMDEITVPAFPREPLMHFSLNAQPVNFLHSAACARARPQQFSWAHVLSSFCSADEMEISRGQNRIGETRLQPELEQHSAFSTQEEGKLRARGGHRHEHPRMGLVLGGPMSTNSTEQSQHNTTQPQYGTRTSCSAAHFRRRCACAAPQSQNTRNDNTWQSSTSPACGEVPTTCSLQLAAVRHSFLAQQPHTHVCICGPTARALAAGSSSTGRRGHPHTYIHNLHSEFIRIHTPRPKSKHPPWPGLDRD